MRDNLRVYFRFIYEIWYKGSMNMMLEQVYVLSSSLSLSILISCFIPWMTIFSCIIFLCQCMYSIKYIYMIWQCSQLNIYADSWEETLFNLVDLQNEIQFCKVKPNLDQQDIKQYILFYDKYLSSLIQKKIIPFPNIINYRIYHYVLIDLFVPKGKITIIHDDVIKKRFIFFGLFYIVLFPFSIFLIFGHVMRYFELFYGSIKEYEWSNYAFYYYREKEEYRHETMERLKHLDEHAYNVVHHNDKPIMYTVVRIISFICGNILFYCMSFILFENDIFLVRWIGLLGLIIAICQKWMSTRIDDVRQDIVILSSHLEDYNISKKTFSLMYVNNYNLVIHEIITIFQTIFLFLWVYPQNVYKIRNFFENAYEFYFPVGDIKN